MLASTNDSLLGTLRKGGRINNELVARWASASELLAALDSIGREGSSVVVKVDGARPNGLVYTVVVSGGRLGEDFFHKDGATLEQLLREAVEFYVAKVPS